MSRDSLKFGCEVEIGHEKNSFPAELAEREGLDRWEITSDPSVRVERARYANEVRCGVYKASDIGKFHKDLVKVKDSMEWTEANRTMGFHIHFSFGASSDYIDLFDSGFPEYFKARLLEQFPDDRWLQKRMNGEAFRSTNFAKTTYTSDYWDNCGSGDRYLMVNYGAYSRHKTFEVRIFPQRTSVKQLVKYVAFTIRCIRMWLRLQKRIDKKIAFTASVSGEEDVIEIEDKVCRMNLVGVA